MGVSRVAKIKRAKLNQRALLSIGRIIRACAEIEDCVTLFICNLANISESHAVTLLGRSQISTRVATALAFAKMRKDNAADLHKQTFNQAFRDLISCRNAIAHGVLLGKDGDGDYCFLTARTLEPVNGSATQYVAVYSEQALADFAKMAEAAAPILVDTLQLKELREARFRSPLTPHQEGRSSQKQA